MLRVKESGDGGMPYGTAAEGSFGAAGVNGVSSVAFAVYFALRNGKYFLCFFESAPSRRIQVVPRYLRPDFLSGRFFI